MNVLIVEDERQLSHEMEIFLTQQGYHCDVAFTGKSASEKIFVNMYDFVLLDIGLSDSNGFQLLKEAKEAGKESAFIILTARGSVDDKITGLDLGADDYLAKPFSLLELQARMQAILRKRPFENPSAFLASFLRTFVLQSSTLDRESSTLDLQSSTLDLLSSTLDL